jgi:NADH:ubiquinone oxidoreductase subunit 5 (subunit L)/multisubunit Na+/H+ antiporter MnhA subunit
MDFVLITTIPFLLAVIVFALRGQLRSAQQAWLTAAVMAVLFVVLLLRVPAIQAEGALNISLPWMPQIGLTLSFYIDGLALLFGLLVTGIGIAVMLYAGYYFEDPQESGRFYGLLLAFTGSMLALVMAGNLLTLFIAWELTSIISFLLISFKGKEEQARSGASQALLITGGGGLALLAGLLLMGSASGTYEFADILASGDLLREHPWYSGIALLLIIGCFSKSAQFPLHFWLPGAMSAPTPASAFLHSATMVKAGVYLLARFYPVLGDTALWETALVGIGLFTFFIGSLLALWQRDLKGILAYTTISQLGALVALIGLPEAHGLKAAMIGILAHALYKGALFLIVGAIDHATGTRNIDELGGLRRAMPGLTFAAGIAVLSMAGIPPLFGFVAKETLLEAVVEQPLLLAAVVISAALMVAAALRLFWDVFMGDLRRREAYEGEEGHHLYGDKAYDYCCDHHLARPMVSAPVGMGVISIIAGVGIAPLISPLVSIATGKEVSLYLFPPYINTPLIMSVTALVIGFAIFATRRFWLGWALPPLPTGAQVFRLVVGTVEGFGDLLLRSQGGKIRYYLVVILLGVAILLSSVIGSVVEGLRIPPIRIENASNLLKAFLLALALATTLASVLFERHLLAVLALGISGYAVGGIFLLEPAPDVALVQFIVETLATVLLVIILARTSDEERRAAMQRVWGQTRAGLVRDAVIALVIGAVVTVFALAAVGNRPTANPISAWHLENALPELGVNDVVAGIVTDFRGTDTLVEITVFGMAAIGVLTLLARPNPGKVMPSLRKLFARGQAYQPKDAIQEDSERPDTIVYRSQFITPVTQLAAEIVLPIAFLIAIAHMLYAGVAPGDGFTAGVIAGLGVALWFVVFGYEETKRRLRWLSPALIVGVGLVIAFANAILPLLFGRSFFAFTEVTGFSFADIKLASTLVFEVGICLAVFGGVSAIMEAISHPKEVEPL